MPKCRNYQRKESEFEQWLGIRFVIYLYVSLIGAIIIMAPYMRSGFTDPLDFIGSTNLLFGILIILVVLYTFFLGIEYSIFRLSKFLKYRKG